jgi:hypothetical protein
MKKTKTNNFPQILNSRIGHNQPGAGAVWTQLMQKHRSDSYKRLTVKQVPSCHKKTKNNKIIM